MNIRKNKNTFFYILSLKGSLSIFLADSILIFIIALLFFNPNLLSFDIEKFYNQHFLLFIFFLIIVILITFTINQLYTITESTTPYSLAKKICLSFFITCLSVFTFGYFSLSFKNFNGNLIPALITTFICLFFFRYHLFFNCPKNRSKVIILGANQLSRKILEVTQKKYFKPYEIIGVTTNNPKILNSSFHSSKILGLTEDLSSIVKQYRPNCIVVALRNRRGKLPVRTLLQIKTSGIRIMECTTFYEQVTQKIVVDEFLKPSWFIFEEGFSSSPIYKSIKRIQSFFLSILLITILSPLLAFIALAIKLDSKGPLLYTQFRVGLNGEIFKLYKFRSMYHHSEEENQAKFTTKNDPRITRVGKLIRKIRFDEAPQLFNILKGDMDLIGPRPEQSSFVDHLQSIIPYYNLRHSVRPGLTGWAQVKYRYGDSFQAAQEKLHYDLYYVKNYSWTLDILIAILTLREILTLKGR